jgi:AcrR family transcriptional regulator
MPDGPQTATRVPRGTLSRERIVDAAWTVLRADGADAFSMRRVARELGAGAMSLYRHFETRDELIDALTDHASAQVVAQAARSGPAEARLCELFESLHDALQAHPEFVALRLRNPILTPEALRFTDTAVSLLLELGLTPRDAVRAYRTLYFHTFGSAAFARRPEGKRDDARARDAIGALPLGEYPGLGRAREEIAAAASDHETFRYGLEAILSGIRAGRSPRGSSASSST